MAEHPNFEATSALTGRRHLWDFSEKEHVCDLSEDLVDRTEGLHYDLTRPAQYIVEGGVVTVNAGDNTKIDVSALRARSDDKSIVHAGVTALALANYGVGASNYVVVRWLKGESKERTNPQTGETFDSMRYDDAEILVRNGAPVAGDVVLAVCRMRAAALWDYAILIDERSEDYSGVTGGSPEVGEQNLLPNSDLICTETTLAAPVSIPDYWAIYLNPPTRSVPTAATLDEPPCLELQLQNQEGIEHVLIDEARQDIKAAGSCTFLFGIKADGASGDDIISFEIIKTIGGLPLATLDIDVQKYSALTWFALSATYDPALAGNFVFLRIWNNYNNPGGDARFYLYRPTLVRGIKQPKQSRYAYSTAQMLRYTQGIGYVTNGPLLCDAIDVWPVPFRCYVHRIIVFTPTPCVGHNEDYTVTRNGAPTALTAQLVAGANWMQGFNRTLTIFEPGVDLIGVSAAIGAGTASQDTRVSVELQPLVN